MKRVISGILVAVLMCMLVAGYAADEEKKIGELVKEYAAKVLEALTGEYEKDPARFDADWIYLYYTAYNLYNAAGDYYLADLRMNTKQYFGGLQFETQRMLEPGKRLIRNLMNEQYDQWVDGEVSDGEFCEFLIKMGRITFEQESE